MTIWNISTFLDIMMTRLFPSQLIVFMSFTVRLYEYDHNIF